MGGMQVSNKEIGIRPEKGCLLMARQAGGDCAYNGSLRGEFRGLQSSSIRFPSFSPPIYSLGPAAHTSSNSHNPSYSSSYKGDKAHAQ